MARSNIATQGMIQDLWNALSAVRREVLGGSLIETLYTSLTEDITFNTAVYTPYMALPARSVKAATSPNGEQWLVGCSGNVVGGPGTVTVLFELRNGSTNLERRIFQNALATQTLSEQWAVSTVFTAPPGTEVSINTRLNPDVLQVFANANSDPQAGSSLYAMRFRL